MNAVIDRVVQYPNRFKLTNSDTGDILGTFDLSPETGTVSVVGTILNHDLFQSIADDLATRIKTDGGDVSNTVSSFSMAGNRTNITSGEKINVSFGKIAKIINDLKAVAFSGNKADIGLGNVDNTADTDKPVSNATEIELNKKVDKVVGSSLMTDTEHNKLSGIADGAEVNVNADWNATSGDAVILNKPTIPTVPVQSVNSKTGAVVLTGSDIATSSADSEKLDSKSVANMLHLGAYDTYTYADESYTITRKTGYLTIKAEDITDGIGSANKVGAYAYSYDSNKISNALNVWNNIIGISSNGMIVKCVTDDWIGNNTIGIHADSNKVSLSFSTSKTQAEIQALCPIYIQYKLATSTTERVEKNHYSRYNERFILEHNKQEADRSVNLIDLPSGSYTTTAYMVTKLIASSDVLPAGTYHFKIHRGTLTNGYNGLTVTTQSDYSGSNPASDGLWINTSDDYTGEYDFVSDGTNRVYVYLWGVNYGDTFTIYYTMLNRGSVALPYQPYEGGVVHQKGLAETLSAYPTSQKVSETYLSKSDASSTYVAKSSLTSVPTENSTNPITSGGVYTAIAKKLDKGDWREYQFDYVKDTDIDVRLPTLEGTYICQILARGTGDYYAISTCYSIGVFSVYDTLSRAYVGGMPFADGDFHHLSAYIDLIHTTATVRGDLDSLLVGGGTYTSVIRFRKIADD